MSTRPANLAVLFLVDPNSRRLALARRPDLVAPPTTRLERSDGVATGAAARISKTRLGADPKRAAAFMDAALRALYEELGQLIARPALYGEALARFGAWGRLARHRLAPDRQALTYLGRAIDPAEAAQRRHMRVFAAPVSRVSNSIKRRGRAERMVWCDPESFETLTGDATLAPHAIAAMGALGGRPRPLLVQFRAGQRRETRL